MLDPARLEDVTLVAGLNAAARRELAARGRIARFKADDVLWRAGADPAGGLHVVLSGRVHVVAERDGRPHRVHTEEAGGTLGEIPLFDGGGYPATVTAVTDAECLVIPRGALRAAIAADPELAFRLLQRMGRRVRTLIGRLDAMVTLDVRQRLARHLLELSEAVGGPSLRFTGSQADLAEELGTVREVVVRTLREMQTAGLIERRGRQVRILDRQTLLDLSG